MIAPLAGSLKQRRQEQQLSLVCGWGWGWGCEFLCV